MEVEFVNISLFIHIILKILGMCKSSQHFFFFNNNWIHRKQLLCWNLLHTHSSTANTEKKVPSTVKIRGVPSNNRKQYKKQNWQPKFSLSFTCSPQINYLGKGMKPLLLALCSIGMSSYLIEKRVTEWMLRQTTLP